MTITQWKSVFEISKSKGLEVCLSGYVKRVKPTTNRSGPALAKYNVHNELKLQKWLGITKFRDPVDPQRDLITASKKDPKSRLM